MNYKELKNVKVLSIHYPSWSEFFARNYEIEDYGEEFKINNYVIVKDQIESIEIKNNRIDIKIKGGNNIFLFKQ